MPRFRPPVTDIPPSFFHPPGDRHPVLAPFEHHILRLRCPRFPVRSGRSPSRVGGPRLHPGRWPPHHHPRAGCSCLRRRGPLGSALLLSRTQAAPRQRPSARRQRLSRTQQLPLCQPPRRLFSRRSPVRTAQRPLQVAHSPFHFRQRPMQPRHRRSRPRQRRVSIGKCPSHFRHSRLTSVQRPSRSAHRPSRTRQRASRTRQRPSHFRQRRSQPRQLPLFPFHPFMQKK